MTYNLLQSAKEFFSGNLISRASSYLSEDESGVQKAVDAAIPTVGMAIFDKAKTSSGAETLLSLIREGNHNGSFLQNAAGAFDIQTSGLSKGKELLEQLLGNKTDNASAAISQYAGISKSSVLTLLSTVAPVILSLLGRHIGQSNLDSKGLFDFINNQKSSVTSLIPAGFSSSLGNLGLGLFGTEKVHEALTPKSTTTTSQTYTSEPETSSTNRWIWPLLIFLVIAAAIWYFVGAKGCNRTADTTPTDTTAAMPTDTSSSVIVTSPKGRVDAATGDYLYDVGNIVALKLPNGNVLNVGENSTEAKLVNFLNDKSATVDTAKGNWFEFTNVRFKTGSAQLSDSSVQQLKNFVEIAKAYPAAKFKIGGYTDNTGDSSANIGLSQKRAQTVFAKAISLGTSKGSLTDSKGYGPQYPVGDNNTAEGRAMNRRVAVNVKAK